MACQKNQESRVTNAGTTTSYFKLQKGACQGDPIFNKFVILKIKIN